LGRKSFTAGVKGIGEQGLKGRLKRTKRRKGERRKCQDEEKKVWRWFLFGGGGVGL